MSIVLIVVNAIMVYGKGCEKMKELDLSKTIYELAKNDSEFINHMVTLGFEGVVEGVTLQTVGRVMTLRKGAKVKKIPIEEVVDYFKKQGYNIKE